MGYYTDFALTQDIPIDHITMRLCEHEIPANATYCPFDGKLAYGLTEDLIKKYLEQHGLDYYFDERSKWYDWQDNMRALSKQFPFVTFHLHGEGEENGDIWDAHFRNGKMQLCKAQISIEPFDESKLK